MGSGNNVTNHQKQSLTTLLTTINKSELSKRDLFGRNILHIIIICNRGDLLKHLLKNPEIKTIINKTDYENEWNCLHYIIYYKRLNCYRVLIEYLRSTNGDLLAVNSVLFELIRTKDRNRLTPFQLLDNDFKTFIWIPDYITENDTFHFKYRFKDIDQQSSEPIKIRHILSYYNWWDTKRCGSDVYMFGSNLNNKLGVGDANDRHVPCKLPVSHFKFAEADLLINPRFKLVKLSKSHSVVVTKDGSIFSCGVGSRGRLGHNDSINLYRFKRIEFFHEERKSIKEVAISNDHSIVLTNDNELYSWGLNNYNQLGVISTEEFEPIPKIIFSGDIKKNSSHFKGLAISKVHSLAYTKHDVFSWGLNLGQMGFNSDSKSTIEYKLNGLIHKGVIQASPRKISLRDEIKLVETCETLTCIITSQNDIHIYCQSQHIKLPKIPIRGSLDRNFHKFSPVKTTKPANIVKVVMRSPENIGLLLDSGDVLGFGIELRTDINKTVKYNNIWKSHDSDLRVCDLDIACDGSIVLSTSTGLVFMKHSQSMKLRTNSMSETSLPIPTRNKFRRVDFINKIYRVSCDENFSSFGFIRDDIDLLPLSLSTNTFLKDMEYLSPLSCMDLYRKQDELFIETHKSTYTSDFIYPTLSMVDEEEYETDEEDEEEKQQDEESKNLKFDSLLISYASKYDYNMNKKTKTRYTYEQIDDLESKFKVLAMKDEHLIDYLNNQQKHFDMYITCKMSPDFKIGIHKDIFKVRSPLFKKLLDSDDDMFITEDFQGCLRGNILEFSSNVNIKSIVILVYLVYTNRVISLWDSYPGLDNIKQIKIDFERLCKLFGVADVFGTFTKDETYFNNLRSLTTDNLSFSTTGDSETDDLETLSIKLSDGTVDVCKGILFARSAFFETTLSSRWNVTDELSFNISKQQFMVILNHLYGYSDLKIFEGLRQSSEDIDDFINSILDIIGIADSLLLFQLKALCQLVLKDLITVDNVTILLLHSNMASCNKLFLNCCWYIYNNLELILLNQSLTSLPNEILNELEANIKLLDSGKLCSGPKFNGTDSEGNSRNWMIKDSNNLLNNFVKNLGVFNENFMINGRSSFTPLFDVKVDVPPKEKRSRKNSKKNSVSAERPDVQELKAQAIQNYNESAIEDSFDDSHNSSIDEFEVVTRRRRKTVDFETKSKSKSPSPPVTIPKDRLIDKTIGIRKPSPSVPILSTPIAASFPVLGKSSQNLASTLSNNGSTSSFGLSPHSNWASKSSASPVFNENEFDSDKRSKKLGPKVKLSQRERKKLAQTTESFGISDTGNVKINIHNVSSSNSLNGSSSDTKTVNGTKNDTNPITPPLIGTRKSNGTTPLIAKTVNGTTPSFTKTVNGKTQIIIPINGTTTSTSSSKAFPVLKKKTLPKPLDSTNTIAPTLTEIMIQESLKYEDMKIKEAERKTLSEIQQEQEFNKWWELEAAKVQQQMQGMDIKKKKKRFVNRH